MQEVKKIIERKADFSLVEKEPAQFLLDSETIPEDRFYADVNSAHFECFFKKGCADYLVVFFSGARSLDGGVLSAVGISRYIKSSCTCSVNGQFNVKVYLFTVNQLADFSEVDAFTDEDFQK